MRFAFPTGAGLVALFLHGEAAAVDPLPEGDDGIAKSYPGDTKIGDDPAVILADDFESYSDASGLGDQWDATFQNDQLNIATEAADVFAGNQSLQMTVPQQDAELSNAVQKIVSPELDVLFLRYYSKFQPPYDVVGSSHNGSMISAHYFENGQATPGVPADGTNKFLANLENWRGEASTASPGLLNIYIYHPAQRSQWGDHFFPSGTVLPNSSDPFDFGPEFVSREDIIPELDRWYCYEYMVQANTPGQQDGRIAFWLDGVLAADFHNLRLRDIESLKIDRFGLSFHIGSNPNGETSKWFDNVVAATSYIGPLYEPGPGDTSGSDGGAGTSATTGTGGGSSDGSDGPGTGTDASDAGGSGSATGSKSTGGCGCATTQPFAVWSWLCAWPLLLRSRCGRRTT